MQANTYTLYPRTQRNRIFHQKIGDLNMKLVNEEIRTVLKNHPLYSQEECGMNAEAMVKFFLPFGAWTWYVTEAREDADYGYLFFGLVINGEGEGELGYFTLKELEEVAVPFNVNMGGKKVTIGTVCIERDEHFTPTALKDIDCPYVQEYVRKFNDH